jgi:TrmH family RNA methyltransferase
MLPDITLCHPQHPGNIGFAARAMKTMGFNQMVIVSAHGFDADAAAVTAVDANDILDRARIVRDLRDILDEYHFLAAFTGRARRFRNHILLPELPALLRQQSAGAKTGFVFGREDSGLTNDEIKMCQCVVTIPTSPSFRSLNLSHAVQAACYECRRAGSGPGSHLGKKAARRLEPASGREREAIFQKLDRVNSLIGLNTQEAEKTSKLFRLLFEERPLQKREAGALHRFLDQIVHKDA